MSDFRLALEASGLRPNYVVPDGRWHRCATDDKPKRRNGAYCLSLDGARGWFKNWATDLEANEWRGVDVRSAAKRVRDDEAEQRQRMARRAQRLEAIRSARAFWNGARSPSKLHLYLERKGLSPLGCAGLRVRDGLLVVPVTLGDQLISVQTIAENGQKRFWAGAPVKGGAFVLHRPRAALTAFCEGLATGLAIYQSVRQASVVVAFDCGNLLPVADRLSPTGSVAVCADNDHQTFLDQGVNPGVDAARKVANLIGCGVAFPTGISGTDWADALQEWGEGAGRRIEREILAEAKYVMREPVS